MPITINGTGSITGVTAGGLPSASVTSATIADANITAAKLDGAQSGSAPIYGARAWVNFNGTSTVAIRASGNVSSITDNGTGDYTVNFTTAMPDANYVLVASSSELSGTNATASLKIRDSLATPTTTNIRVSYVGTSYLDPAYAMLAIFR